MIDRAHISHLAFLILTDCIQFEDYCAYKKQLRDTLAPSRLVFFYHVLSVLSWHCHNMCVCYCGVVCCQEHPANQAIPDSKRTGSSEIRLFQAEAGWSPLNSLFNCARERSVHPSIIWWWRKQLFTAICSKYLVTWQINFYSINQHPVLACFIIFPFFMPGTFGQTMWSAAIPMTLQMSS